MAYIQINNITLTPTPPGVVTVTIAYKIASNPDVPASYTTFGTRLVNPDGTFIGGAVFINGLTEGVQYTIHIYAQCFGTKVNFMPIPGANGTSTTTTMPLTTVNWTFTNSGKATDDTYYIFVHNSTGTEVPFQYLGSNPTDSGTFYPTPNYFLSVSNGCGGTLTPPPNYFRTTLFNVTDNVLIYDNILSTCFNHVGEIMLSGKTYTLTIVQDIVGVAPTTSTTTSTTTTAFCPVINNIFINASSS